MELTYAHVMFIQTITLQTMNLFMTDILNNWCKNIAVGISYITEKNYMFVYMMKVIEFENKIKEGTQFLKWKCILEYVCSITPKVWEDIFFFIQTSIEMFKFNMCRLKDD